MVLTCSLQDDFTEESFNRVIQAFDYSNEIYRFVISLDYRYYNFYPQLKAENLGKLNMTHFTLQNAKIQNSLFGEGALMVLLDPFKNLQC